MPTINARYTCRARNKLLVFDGGLYAQGNIVKKFITTIILFFLFGCSSTTPIENLVFLPEFTSNDTDYGYSEENPIKLGGFLLGTEYAGYHQYFFSRLHGPNGEKLQIQRLGSCCEFEDPSMPMGGGLLDRYELKYEGQKDPAVVYVNLYKFESPMAPKGFVLSQ